MPINLYEKAKSRLAAETGAVPIDRSASVRFALAFPNVYSAAMASLGYQLVYEMLNQLPNASCERVFLPDPDDMAEHVRSRTELFAIESQTPLSEFDVVAFSISFELDYLNALRVLEMANIPIERGQRDETRPLVIAGGPCATFNPEPMADFIDAFIVGDAEELLPELVNAIEANQEKTREEMLAALAQVPGVYVPRFYEPVYDESGEFLRMDVLPPANKTVHKATTRDLSAYPARSVIRTSEAEFGDIELVEVSRGCGRQCRFCVAGYMTRPPRPREVSDSRSDVRLGLVGAAVFDHPDIERICEQIVSSGAEFTVSSVRLETVVPKLAKLMAEGGQKTLTIAPEAGSPRLRKVINKNSPEEDMFSAVRSAQEAGLARVKLYFMIGLPTETDEDIDSIIDLVKRLVEAYPSISFQVSASSFVPKPWTPFQWHSMERENVLKRRFNVLKKGLGPIKGVKLNGESPRMAVVQGYLSRGDRRIGRVLTAALANGGDYASAVRESGVDIKSFISRIRGKDEILPWDHIDLGVSKAYLWREYQKAQRGEATAACIPGICKACGACV